MSEAQTRWADCVVCGAEGQVVNKRYSQKEIHRENIEYGGAYVFKRICSDCQNKYIHNHSEIKVDWNPET